MPELPEVETVRTQLDAQIRGAKILDIQIWKSGREKPVGDRFRNSLEGKKIIEIQRRAKLLVFRFEDGGAMTAHLKMTGRFVFVDADYEPSKHDRMLFRFDNGAHLVWNDVRQFGFVQAVSEKELENILSKYGPEPLETSVENLAVCIEHPKTRTIKAALLNQEVIAGIGNIYADEACFRAGIRPTRRIGKMNHADRLNLMRQVKELLKEAVEQRGTSANDYVDTEGKKGGFLSLLRVYGRAGEPCVNCKTPIKKIVLAQRGTHYCSGCQR
ncbi:bifunctional DNA-formamidopyrimidine glycosylase/DNA-(apurinic or apyrimidinic site) lyase [Candidatus Uhrbacteria bacterium]|nr:bifunctional DNA-formamidopyrimidine glycosylase/DNA-(apurinic or apyrimidinic site) lyase [Candidatus Uhrbacteria bacterium]